MNEPAILLRTSAATDVQCSGGVLSIAGLTPTKKSRISSIVQIKGKAEVVQVVKIGGTTFTPTGGTDYTIAIGDTNRIRNGSAEQLKRYTYTTPASITTLGATEAIQREAIYVGLAAIINADASNFVSAATVGGGAGINITDDAGYYPPFSQTGTGRLGASTVLPCANADDSGFAASNVSTTTAATYSSGLGADLAASVPVIDALCGGLLSGYLYGASGIAPKTLAGLPAVSGQIYDLFVISTLDQATAFGGRGDQIAFVPKVKVLAVDNGTGTATTNLTGFKAIERVMHKQMAEQFASDPSTTREFFDKPIVFQDPLGAAPTGTANTLGWQLSPYGSLNRTNIGTQTIVAPVLDATGLLIDQDDTATEGSHTSANQQTLSDQSFVVGKTAFMAVARVVMGDWTDSAFKLGFRKKAVYDAVINNYTDYATVGNGSSAAGTTWINGDLFVTQGNINSGTPVQAISAVAPADGVSVVFMLKVAIDGTVSAYVNGTSYPIYSVGTTTLIFDAGDEMIPFYQHVNIGGGDPAVSISEFFAVPTDQLIS